MSTLTTTPQCFETSIDAPETRAIVETILRGQRSGILGTCFMDIPLCSQMAFAATEDLRSLILATPRQSAKYENMSANPNVSFLVSTARNEPSDPDEAQALTATAFATELDGERRHKAITLYARKHPDLLAFASNPATAVMELKVDSYVLISNFQRVTRIGM